MDAVDTGVADRVWFDYAYTMHTEEYWVKRDSLTHYYSDKNGGSSTAASHQHITRTVKMRDYASPFGFGLDSPSLHQQSILGAMGISSLDRRI